MEVLLFGITRDIVGAPKITVQANAEENLSVRSLKNWLAKEYPELGKLTSLAVAVDSEYAEDDFMLKNEMEVALIPPVSGG